MTAEIDQYDYELPRHLIAQQPVASRVDARLLVVDRQRQTLAHHYIRDLPEFLGPGDCLVLNDTQVVPARLLGRRESTRRPLGRAVPGGRAGRHVAGPVQGPRKACSRASGSA